MKDLNSEGLSIGFDAKRALYNKSGLGNYSRNLLSALQKFYPGNRYLLFTPKTKKHIHLEYENEFVLVEPESPLLKLFSSLWRTRFIVDDIRKHKPDIFHGLSHELPVGIEKTGVRSVVTVHDLIFLRYPELYSRIDAGIYLKKVIHACRIADHIIAISQQTKDDLVEFLRVDPERISVIYQGYSSRFKRKLGDNSFNEIRNRHNLPDRYLLYVGTIEARKNLMGIIRAIHTAKIEMPLVVIGKKTEPYFKKIEAYVSSNNLNNIIFTGKVSDDELPAIYRNAECFVYPSFFEGFGIPLIEAMVSGVPVITSRGGCFKEAAGPGSLYVDPDDIENIGESIKSVIGNEELKNKMISAGLEHVKNFSDENIALSYMNFYRNLVKS
jgi:glycosyltransferase involved in cell wall biosynthesis